LKSELKLKTTHNRNEKQGREAECVETETIFSGILFAHTLISGI